jgi:hypothetical protein
MSVPVQVFGRRDDGTIHALRRRRPKSAQGRRSRSDDGSCRERYGYLAAERDVIVFLVPSGFDSDYNFSVVA